MKNLIVFALAFAMLVLTSCSKEELTSTDTTHQAIFHNSNLSNAIDFLSTESDLSLFYEAILITKMDVEIDGEISHTIFAPTNMAFEKWLSTSNWVEINDVPKEDLKRYIQFHISERDVKITDLTRGKYVPTLYKERELFIDVDNPSEPFLILGVTMANILSKDHQQCNGMVNKIDNVLSL